MIQYDLKKIKFGTDKATFERGVDLYQGGKVTKFQKGGRVFSAVVLGTKQYDVFVSERNYDRGECNCYLGQKEILCKHMIAVAIYAVMDGKQLTEEDQKVTDELIFSGRIGELTKEEVSAIKKEITSAMSYIKAYRGPSRIWFSYQSSLQEGCNRLSYLISELPVSKQTADLLVNLLLRLDRKLSGGVDDSDGTVGGFIYEVVDVLTKYTEIDCNCIKSFEKILERETMFGWEEPLIRILDEGILQE
ncbi:MAG: hypothetical protein KY054_01870 [Candidatus Nealsonbacteria bacterium]|nr:hypothetical protein [Candidatus Nealsonbacteria bacterium]